MEFGIVAPVLLLIFMSVFDIASYIYQRLEVENAAQMGAQAAWHACRGSMLPATDNCTAMRSAIDTAIQSTTLGQSISLHSGSPSEGYYCITETGTLQHVGAVSGARPSCTAPGMPTQPGDYIQVQVAFSYSPKFPGLGIGSLLPTPIIRTALMRLG